MYISPAEARRFVDVLPPHISLAFAFSYYTGCRLDELATLTWDRVSIDERVALVVTKGRGKKNTVFFLENRRKHWERARRIVGRPDVVWHGIRHSFGTETSRRAKASDKLIGKMLGHAPGSNATQRYIHAMADDVYEALSLLPDIGMPNVLAQEVEQAQLTIPANNGEQKLLPQI
jgi:integrase